MAEPIPPIDTLICTASRLFQREFKSKPTLCGCAPGRVNLIGEHTDYNDGFVFPMALPLVTIVIGSPASGNTSTVITTSDNVDDPKKVTIDMNNVTKASPKWANYVKGVIANYPTKVPAFNAIIHSSVPTGGGVSSSASLEVSVYMFLDALVNKKCKDLKSMALACQKAEHEFADMPCGIMDQFIALMGKEDHALLIDCRSLTSELVPLLDPNIVVLIANTNVKHELTGSEYPTRRKQCEKAAELLGVKKLRDASIADIEKLKSKNAEEDVIKRARHVITEIERTMKATEALKQKDFNLFGQLMYESHSSLRDDFEVSTPELDNLVCSAKKVKGVYGSRMTGGGFGGCTVTLVTKDAVNDVIEYMKKHYPAKATFYVCKASEAARIIEIPKQNN